MSEEVKRYTPEKILGRYISFLPAADGKWVLYTDYEALQKEIEAIAQQALKESE